MPIVVLIADVAVLEGQFGVTPTVKLFEFQTTLKVSKTGYVHRLLYSHPSLTNYCRLMMIGMGGNNGSALCATLLANKHQIFWYTKEGIQQPNYIGSVLRTSTVRLGSDPKAAKEIHVPICDVLPMVHPNDLVLGE